MTCCIEIQRYWPEHYSELASNKEIELAPDYDWYVRTAMNGCLHVVTVRDGDKLVGYHISIVAPHIHYRNSLTAHTDIYFLDKAYRKGFFGIDLFKFMEESLKARGVERIYMMTKTDSDKGKILDRLGYVEKERIYTKMIGD